MVLLGLGLGMGKAEAEAAGNAGERAFRPWMSARAFSRRAFSRKLLLTPQPPADTDIEMVEVEESERAPAAEPEILDITVSSVPSSRKATL